MRLQDLDKLFVLWVGQIDFAVLFAFESHEEAMGKTIGEAFRAVVRAVLKCRDFGNRLFEGAECVDYLLNVFFAARLFELEHHDVAQHTIRLVLCEGERESGGESSDA